MSSKDVGKDGLCVLQLQVFFIDNVATSRHDSRAADCKAKPSAVVKLLP